MSDKPEKCSVFFASNIPQETVSVGLREKSLEGYTIMAVSHHWNGTEFHLTRSDIVQQARDKMRMGFFLDKVCFDEQEREILACGCKLVDDDIGGVEICIVPNVYCSFELAFGDNPKCCALDPKAVYALNALRKAALQFEAEIEAFRKRRGQ
jgi:hypothetical protein